MQYLQGLPADVGAIPLLLCATKEDLPGKRLQPFVSLKYDSILICSHHVRRNCGVQYLHTYMCTYLLAV